MEIKMSKSIKNLILGFVIGIIIAFILSMAVKSYAVGGPGIVKKISTPSKPANVHIERKGN